MLLTQFLIKPEAEVVESAEAGGEYDLVAILVDQNLYSLGSEDGNGVTGKIYRYAEDVQKALPNTKALILPISPTESPFQIFSLLEKLFLEGESKSQSRFFLQGVVLFGEVPLPLIAGTVPFRSIFPYTDLADPAFLWDESRQTFIPNPAGNTPAAEIWHGVIRGTESEISSYLDRNHDLHERLNQGETPYSDQIFFADLLSEQDSMSQFALDQYDRGQKYSEEVAYSRYHKYLLQKLQQELTTAVNPSAGTDDDRDGRTDEDLLDLKDNDGDGKVDEDDGYPPEVQAGLTADENLKNLPDVHLKARIDQLLPEYLKAIGQVGVNLQDQVAQSGRWSEGQVLTVPKLITAMDLMSRETLKSLNDFLEKKVTTFVRDEWQRDVRMVQSVEVKTLLDSDMVFNRLNGKSLDGITSAEDCTLTWGSPRIAELTAQGASSQSVEYNRLLDPASANECSQWGGCCINNLSNQSACMPERAQRQVFSWGGNRVNETAANASNFRACQSLAHFELNNDSGTPGDIETKEVSSVFMHDAPRPEQIQNALKNPTAGHIPSDGIRFLSFQGPGGNLQKVEFLNSFKFTPSTTENTADVWTQFLNFAAAKEKEIETKIIADNLLLFAEYVFLKTGNFDRNHALDSTPTDQFLQQFLQYRQALERELRVKLGNALDVPDLWRTALRQDTAQFTASAERIFDQYFQFSPATGAQGTEIKNIFKFWQRDIDLSFALNPRGATDVVTLARETSLGRQGNTQTFKFRPAPLPAANFLQSELERTANPLLPLFLRWKELNVHEKHSEIVRLFFDSEVGDLPLRSEKPFALSYFRSAGDANMVFWGGAQDEKETDAEWEQLQAAQRNRIATIVEATDIPPSGQQSACAPIQGVDIWKWIPAVQCWLESLKELGITVKRICGLGTDDDPLSALPQRDRRTGELVDGLSREPLALLKLTSEPSVLSTGMTGTIRIEGFDAQGKKAAASGRVLSLFLTGPGEIASADQDPELAGTQLFLTGSELRVQIKVTGSGEIVIRSETEQLANAELKIGVLNQMKLALSATASIAQEQNRSLASAEVTVQDAEGKLLENFSGTATAAVSDPTVAVLGNPTVEIINGKGMIPLALSGAAVNLTVSMPFAESAVLALGAVAERPIALVLPDAPHFIDLNNEVRFPLQVLFSSGRVSTELADIPEGLQLKLTEASKQFAQIGKAGNAVVLRTGRVPGVIHLAAEAPGLEPALLEIQVGALIESDEFAAMAPHSLITQIFGPKATAVNENSGLARNLLFSGQSAVVTGFTTENALSAPRAVISANGAMNIGEEGIIAAISSLAPLKIKVMDALQMKALAEFAPQLQSEARVSSNIPPAGATGLFFENLDSAGVLTAEATDEGIELKLEERSVLKAQKNLQFEILDQRFSLEVDPSFSNGIKLKLLLDHETLLGHFVISGAKITVLTAPRAESLADGGFFLPGDPAAEKIPLLPNMSDAVAQNLSGIGWEEGNMANLLLASGQSVGSAFKTIASPLLLTWGDPTLALKRPNAGSTGFDQTVGQEVFFSSEGDLTALSAGDFDGDGETDLLLQRDSDTVEFLQNSGSGVFRNFGAVAKFGKGISETTVQKMHDGFAQLFLRDGEGDMTLLKNEAEVLNKTELDLFPNGVEELATADFDHDGVEDLIAQQTDGKLNIFYGSSDGYKQENSILLDQLGTTLSTADRSADLLISVPGMATIVPNGPIFVAPDDPQKLVPFAALSNFPNLGIRKRIQDENGGTVRRGDRLRVEITIPAQAQEIALVDPVAESSRLIPESLNCNGCGAQSILLEPSKAGSTAVQLWKLPKNTALTVRYSLEVLSVPKIEFVFEELSEQKYPQDEITDVSLFIPEEPQENVTTYVSTGKRAYRKVLRTKGPVEQPANSDLIDANGNGIPDRFERDSDGDGIPDIVKETQREWEEDQDEDGIPDYWDNTITFRDGILKIPTAGSKFDQDLNEANAKLDTVLKKVSNSTCQSGSCVASPINLAFLVPGKTNITSGLASLAMGTLMAGAKPVSDFANIVNLASGGALSSGVATLQGQLNSILGKLAGGSGVEGPDINDAFPVFGLIPSTTGVSPCTGKACLVPGGVPYLFRLYVSPTITGGTAVAFCRGGYNKVSPDKNCFAMGLPLLSEQGVCDQINESVLNFFTKANAAVSSRTGGQVAFVVDEGKGPSNQGGNIQVKFPQGLIRWNTSAGRNAVPAVSPGFFDRWISAQMDEVKKMFRLPAFTLIYPNLNGRQPEGSVADAYERLRPLTEAGQDAKEAVESITEIYELLRSIPLLDIRERRVSIAVPHLSETRLHALLSDFEAWTADADKELSDWRNFVAVWECPKNTPAAECTKAKLAWQKMRQQVTIEHGKLLQAIQRNIEILHDYTSFGNIVAHYEEELAKYINGVICYVDAISDLMGGWFQKNLTWVKAWIRFYKTVEVIMRDWKELFKAPDLAVRNCSACTADTYATAGNTFEQVFGALPNPPVIEFPKLPDIVLDLSAIKAALIIEVPQLDFYPQEIDFPQLPRLKLPRIPTATLTLPSIPLLPEMPELPTLPDFPDVPIPELPTIPPPPKLPAVSADLQKIIKVVSKLARLFCLYKQGLFVYAESELRPVIETLTNRPASILLDIDFLNLAFPNIEIPWVDEIRVRTEVNFTLEFTTIVESLRAQAQKWNKLIFERKSSLLQKLNERFDFGDLLDFEDLLPENIEIKPKPQEEMLPERDRRPSDPVDPLNSAPSTDPLSFELQKTAREFIALAQSNGLVAHEDIALQTRISDPLLLGFENSPASRDLQKLVSTLSRMETGAQERARLLAAGDTETLFRSSGAALKEAVADHERFASTSFVPTTTSLLPERSAPQGHAFLVPEPETEGSLQSDAKLQNAEFARKGIFVFDTELEQAQKVVTFAGLDDLVRQVLFSDVDQDGDEDLLILTPYRLLLKKNQAIKENTSFLSTPPEIGRVSDFLPPRDAVKNISVESGADRASIAFSDLPPVGADEIAGVEILLQNTATGLFRPTATRTKYIELLYSEYAQQGFEPNRFLTTERPVNILGRTVNPQPDDEIMFAPLESSGFEFPLEEGFWTVRLRWLLKNGTTGTFSQSRLAAPQPGNDQNPPLFVGTNERLVPVFTKQKISAEGVFDLESGMRFEWDFKADGSIEAQGYEIEIGPFLEPKTEAIRLHVTDAGGNTLDVPLTLNVFVPDIALEGAPLADDTAEGELTPETAGMPFALLRERFKTWKLIRTPSADANGRYFTDQEGRFEITDFNPSPDALIKDTEGKVIARVSGRNSRIFLEQSGYELRAFPGDAERPARIAVLAADGTIVGNVLLVASGESSVTTSPEAISAQNANKLFGVTLFDRDAADSVEFRGLPEDAPSFPGGAALLDRSSQKVLAMISRDGDIRFLQNGLSLTLKGAEHPETDPVLLQIASSATPLFDIYVRTAFPEITLHHGEYWNEKPQAVAAASMSPEIGVLSADDSLAAAPLEFSDVAANHPYATQIRALVERGILHGYSDGRFRPDQEINRAEFTKVVLGATVCADCTNPTAFEWERFFEPFPFPDVNFGAWYAFCVSKAKKLGFVQGYGDGTFRADRNITRAEAVAILLRAAGVKLTEPAADQKLTDVPEDAWYRNYISTALGLGLIPLREGGFVLPEQPITRGEFAFMAAQMLTVADCREKDSDGDGIPDHQEIANGLDEHDAADADEDIDRDGVSNADEIEAGTNPHDPDNGAVPTLPGEGSDTPDLCPNLPEDIDGIEDQDGCPEVPASSGGSAGVHIFPGDPKYCGFLDFLADLRPGDRVKAAILNGQNTKIFSESAAHTIP